MRKRARESDPKTFNEFLRVEEAERKNKDPDKQNIEETTKLAEKTIVNDGAFSKLYDAIDHILAELSGDFMVERPSWDEYFMSIAEVVARRSNCMKRNVAAVIIRDKRIISTGYNGTPRGVRNCNEGGCERCNTNTESGKNLADCVCSHGEENAIVQSAYHGIEIKGSTLYSTFSPCLLCTKMIINAGIQEVIYNAEYPLADISTKLMKEAGIVVRKFEKKGLDI
jgi:dCMP deaminase